MKYRPGAPDGDILPVTAAGELLEGTAAAAAALTDRLRLFRGDVLGDVPASPAVLEAVEGLSVLRPLDGGQDAAGHALDAQHLRQSWLLTFHAA